MILAYPSSELWFVSSCLAAAYADRRFQCRISPTLKSLRAPKSWNIYVIAGFVVLCSHWLISPNLHCVSFSDKRPRTRHKPLRQLPFAGIWTEISSSRRCRDFSLFFQTHRGGKVKWLSTVHSWCTLSLVIIQQHLVRIIGHICYVQYIPTSAGSLMDHTTIWHNTLELQEALECWELRD